MKFYIHPAHSLHNNVKNANVIKMKSVSKTKNTGPIVYKKTENGTKLQTKK